MKACLAPINSDLPRKLTEDWRARIDRSELGRMEMDADRGNAREAPLHGDVLELMLSHVPLVDLVPASHVSSSWRRAVASSLQNLNAAKPWFVVHHQGRRSNCPTTIHTYDPRSGLWMEVVDARWPPVKLDSAIRSSNSALLYALCPSRLSFSFDPLNLTWHHVSAPLIWRTDAVVARVGHRIVVAGGTCDFEDDPLSVETYDMRTGAWSRCQPMPAILKDSSASLWISVAANDHRMYLTEKVSGVTYSYDPEVQVWSGPYDLRPDGCVYYSVIGFAGDRLILVGLIGSTEEFKSLKLWGIGPDHRQLEEITEIPAELGEMLKDECTGVPSIVICTAGDFVYMLSPGRPENVVWCEVAAAGGEQSKWGSVGNAALTDASWMERMVFTCASIGVAELETAVAAGSLRFRVKETETRHR